MSVIQYVVRDAGTFPEDAFFSILDTSMSSFLSGNWNACLRMPPLIILTIMTAWNLTGRWISSYSLTVRA